MKKYLCLFFVTVALVSMVACSGGSSAGESAKQYAEYIAEGEYDKFVEAIYVPEGTPAEDVEQGRTMLKSIISGMGAEMMNEKGGLDSVEIISEEVTEEEDTTAEVTLRYIYGGGETSEETMSLILDSKVWKVLIY